MPRNALRIWFAFKKQKVIIRTTYFFPLLLFNF